MTLPVRFTLRNETLPSLEPDTNYTIVETMPEFPGGELAMRKFITKNLVYPPVLKKTNEVVDVYITFEIERDGIIRNAKVVRGFHPLADEEALRVVNSMPPWTPGKQRGKPVRVQFTLPIRFRPK